MNDKSYNADNITVLEGLSAVRKRPSMYIGDTGIRGLHHLVFEVVDNSIDEALAGFCTEIKIIIEKDNSVTVIDNGRGIPTEVHPKYNMSAMQVVLTKLHAGGKFDNNSYKVSGGLHGVGVSVVNALSSFFKVEVTRNGKLFTQTYSRGMNTSEVEIKSINDENASGTSINFIPDKEIFSNIGFHFETLSSRLRELAFLNKGIKIIISDKISGIEKIFNYNGGIKEFVIYLNKGKRAIHDVIYLEASKDNVCVEVAMQYNEGFNNNEFSFANNINTKEGGTHLTGFRSALTRAFNLYADKNNLLKTGNSKNCFKLTSDDLREGLVSVISVKIPNPQFEGQTKTKLGNSEVKGIVDSIVFGAFSTYLEEHPKEARLILQKAITASRARDAARKARDFARRKNALEISSLPGKLADCSSQDPSCSEIFIVEGDSAGGSAKQGRNREIQAILPLRGKILNVEKSRLNKILSNNEIITIITALGTSIGTEFDISKLRYHKIIIMTDADVDGQHITCLTLTFFYRYLTELIEKGHLFIAQPPIYKISKGKNEYYILNEHEKQKLLDEHGADLSIQRFKGLGEMNPEQLWDTTMNPDTRVLKKVTIEDAVEADKIFTILMGDEVEPRKNFILNNAKKVENLDI